MNSSNIKGLAKEVSFDDDLMWVELTDGRRLGVPLAYFPRLMKAKPKQRDKCTISGGGIGLHWDELDEDISVEGLLLGISDRTQTDAEAA